jgi:hypothetical protein
MWIAIPSVASMFWLAFMCGHAYVFEAPSSNGSSCDGYICGNKQFANDIAMNPTLVSHRTVKIVVFSIWVGPEPLDVFKLNHVQYCDHHGYQYKHFYYNQSEFERKYSGVYVPPAWMSVYAAQELLQTSDADYFFKLDVDCVFARSDVRLESLLDPLERYSFYTTRLFPNDGFMQSQSWIVKNTNFGKALIKEWLEYAKWGNCGDLAQEQGAMHLAIGMAYSWAFPNATAYTCPAACMCISFFVKTITPSFTHPPTSRVCILFFIVVPTRHNASLGIQTPSLCSRLDDRQQFYCVP